MRSVAESRMTMEGQQNAGGVRKIDDNGKPYYDQAPLSEYPRMMFKATDVERVQPFADEIAQLKDAPMVINRYEGLLCDTIVANSATEAEALSESGWDVSPKAAHGVVDGLAKATSAKDDEIAALKAQIAAMQPNSDETPVAEKRGPGRPRLAPAE